MIYCGWRGKIAFQGIPPDAYFLAHTTSKEQEHLVVTRIAEYAQANHGEVPHIIEQGYDGSAGQSWFYVQQAQRDNLADFLRPLDGPEISVFEDKKRTVWKGQKLTEVQQEAFDDVVTRFKNLELD